jgi:hypothetical protein
VSKSRQVDSDGQARQLVPTAPRPVAGVSGAPVLRDQRMDRGAPDSIRTLNLLNSSEWSCLKRMSRNFT